MFFTITVTPIVSKKEQKRIPEQIVAIIERIDATFDRNKATGDWLRRGIEDVLHPNRTYERNHPNVLTRLAEYIAQQGGTKQSKSGIENLQRKLTQYLVVP